MSIIPKTYLYRHDDIMGPRPYAVDVDRQDWLWEGVGAGRLIGHNLRTAERRIIPVPDAHAIYSVFCWQDRIVLIMGKCPYYLILDPATGRTERRLIPAAEANTWYGLQSQPGKLLLFERTESKVLVLDASEAPVRAVKCPFPGQLGGGIACSDGMVYAQVTNPARFLRFDPVRERFVDEVAAPFPEAGISGTFEEGGVLYCADALNGRLLPYELATGRWRDPIPTPEYNKVYGFVGGAFGCGGKGFFCLSTCRLKARLDPKTGGGVAISDGGPESVDGRPMRFMERYLVFEPASGKFDFMAVPPQPDGMPLLCYAWTDGKRFAITGIVMPFQKPGEPGTEELGHWLVFQSEPAEAEPGFPPYDFNWDRMAHLRKHRRGYASFRSPYLPEEPHSPPTVDLRGPATQYLPGENQRFSRRAAKTDAKTYWQSIAARLFDDAESPAGKAKRVGSFVQRSLYYNPIQVIESFDPIAVLESHDARCGHGVNITLAILKAAGLECRATGLSHHIVGEVFHDGGWHILDALFFGGNQPARDGQVLSVEALKADPYFADAWPQWCFAYDPELLSSEDGHQVLGYVFGPWGSEPYYSYYLGAPKELPPTRPTGLPAKRLGPGRVLLRWSEAVKYGGGEIKYSCRVCADRACRETLWETVTRSPFVAFDVPEANRMYFAEFRAMDDHRKKNPATWYAPGHWNFVSVPSDQYGWYGVID